jgi:superoxide dismutase, Fe-Mn family
MNQKYPFILEDLPYPYDALEPFIDEATMRLHHDKHHATYVAKLNEAMEKHPQMWPKTLLEILSDLESAPEDIRIALRNHGGGHYNHSLFWSFLRSAKENNYPSGRLLEAINIQWGGFEEFKKDFEKKALSVFGSGWVWLVEEDSGSLAILTTPNQDCPTSSGVIVLGLDVWEHAYYLKYQNKRAEYVENWWNIVNWEEVEKRLEKRV